MESFLPDFPSEVLTGHIKTRESNGGCQRFAIEANRPEIAHLHLPDSLSRLMFGPRLFLCALRPRNPPEILQRFFLNASRCRAPCCPGDPPPPSTSVIHVNLFIFVFRAALNVQSSRVPRRLSGRRRQLGPLGGDIHCGLTGGHGGLFRVCVAWY